MATDKGNAYDKVFMAVLDGLKSSIFIISQCRFVPSPSWNMPLDTPKKVLSTLSVRKETTLILANLYHEKLVH